MLVKNREKFLQSISGNDSLGLFSLDGLSYNSTYASVDIAFKPGVTSNMEKITIIGNEHNIKKYRIVFYDLDHGIIAERLFQTDQDEVTRTTSPLGSTKACRDAEAGLKNRFVFDQKSLNS